MMPIRRRRGWHRDSVVQTASSVALGFVLILVALVIGPIDSGLSLFGRSLDLLLAIQAVPVALVVLVFWFVFRQEAVDRKYHRVED